MPFFQDDPQVVAPRSLEGATRSELHTSAAQYKAVHDNELLVWQGTLLLLCALAWFVAHRIKLHRRVSQLETTMAGLNRKVR